MSGKKPKVDPASPFAKLKEIKDKLAAEEAAAKAAKAAPKPVPGAAARPAFGGSGGASASAGRPPPSPKTRARELKSTDAEDAIAFHRLVSGVTPLEAPSRRIPKSQDSLDAANAVEQAKKRAAAKADAEQESAAVHEHLRTLVEGGTRFEVSDDGRRVEGRRVDVPPDMVRKLRRGVMPIDARLDLHGFAAGGARDALDGFLREKRARGERCVLVVHGKGDHSPHGHGVLRGEISAWLSQGKASEHVAAFATAADDDGGEGAVYVLLRK